MARPKASDATNPIEAGTSVEDERARNQAIFQRVQDAFAAQDADLEAHDRQREEILAGHREAISAAVQEANAISDTWKVNGTIHKVRKVRGNENLLTMTGFRPTAPAKPKENPNVVEL